VPLYSTESLTSAQAKNLNKRILELSHSQIFGQTKASLLSL